MAKKAITLVIVQHPPSGESGQSNSSHRHKKGKGRGGRGGANKGSSGSGGSQSGSQRQQQGSTSGSVAVAGAPAPQRAVQVGPAEAAGNAAAAPMPAPQATPTMAPGSVPAAPSVGSSPSTWTAGWGSYPAAVQYEPAQTAPPVQPAQPWRHVGLAAYRPSDEVPVEFEDKFMPAELSLPNQREKGAVAIRSVLDSGADFISISQPIVEFLKRMFPGTSLRIPFSLGPRLAVTASGQQITVTERTIPLQLAFITPYGPEFLPPTSFAIMPGSDGVVCLGLPTLQDLGVDPYSRLQETIKLRRAPPGSGVETAAFLGSRRVSLSVEAFQDVGGQVAKESDEAVERLVERGPEMFMAPAEEESARTAALEKGVADAVADGLSDSKAERLRGNLKNRFNAFRRALRRDPPARVEPMRVQLKPGASTVKAKALMYDPGKTYWLGACMAALLAFGLVF